MGNTFTLDNFREAAEKSYSNTQIDLGGGATLVLTNALRLDKKVRKQLIGVQERLDLASKGQSDEELDELLAEALGLVATNKASLTKFLKAVDGDITVLIEVFKTYSGQTELGEA